MKIVKIKSKNKIGVLNFESKMTRLGFRILNNVSLEDGTLLAVCDDDIEVIGETNDRSESIEE